MKLSGGGVRGYQQVAHPFTSFCNYAGTPRRGVTPLPSPYPATCAGEYRPPMNQTVPACRQLSSIARRAMLQRGMLPDFSTPVLAETDKITRAATEIGTSIRALRSLRWVSIDNDDSRDLNQLSVAVPNRGGATKILVAVADVDTTVKKDSAIDGHAQGGRLPLS